MTRALFQFIAVSVVIVSAAVAWAAGAPIYDEGADPRKDIAAAVSSAHAAGKLVFVLFGANWCPDCRRFDGLMNEAETAGVLAEHYEVVKVDIGRFTKNLDVGESYGVVVRRGIPAIAVLSGDGRPLMVADGLRMDNIEDGGKPALLEFLNRGVTLQASAPRR